MAHKSKKRGVELGTRLFRDSSDKAYLVFKTAGGSFHVFAEIEAKEAAERCGAKREPNRNVRSMWNELWKKSRINE
jgi:hypothetical protein